MTHMLERPRVRRSFDRADILSQFGETICLAEMEIAAPKWPEPVKPQCEKASWEEEPERWDGMS